MKKGIQAKREAIAAKRDQARKLHEDNQDQWSDELQGQFDGLMKDIDDLQAAIDRQVRLDGLADPDGDDAAAIAARAAASGIEVKAKPVYRNIGEQMLDVMAMTTDNSDAPKARDRFQKVVNAATGASTGVDSDGGYLVETDKAGDIKRTAVETGVLSSRCARQPIGANADSFSYLAFDDRDRSAGTMLGGIQVYRKGEATLMSSSGKAQMEERELQLEDMYGLIYVTNRMLRDAVALAEYSKRGLRDQLAWKLDYEIFIGNGAGQCLGIMNSDIVISVAKVTDQTAKTINATNVVNMLARFKGDITKAAWFVNQDCLPQFPLMTVGNQPVFIPGGSFANAPFGTLFGRPIVPIEFCKTLGTVGDIILGDFSEYLLIEKGGIEEAESMHVRFLYDEMAFRFKTRNNGQPVHESAITPLNGTNTLSPFVALATRG